MRLVKANLTFGQNGPEIANLQSVLQFLISTETIKLIKPEERALLNDLICCEVGEASFGNATLEIIKLFCTQQGITIGTPYIVDDKVANKLNQFLTSFSKTKSVRGRVFYKVQPTKKIATGVSVDISVITYKNSDVIETVDADENGNYSCIIIEDLSGIDGAGAKGLTATATIDQKTYTSEVVYAYGQDIAIDIAIEDEIQLISEYTAVQSKLQSAIGQASIKDIDIDDRNTLTLLSNQISELDILIIRLVQSARLFDALAWGNEQLYYALLRQNMPPEMERLVYQPKEFLSTNISVAITSNIIDSVDQQTIDDFINGLGNTIIQVLSGINVAEGGIKASIFNNINYILQDMESTAQFLSELYNFTPNEFLPTFWDYLVDTDQFPGFLPWLNATLILSTLTGSNSAIVPRVIDILKGQPRQGDPSVQVDPNNPLPELLVAFDASDWYTIVSNAQADDPLNFFYPVGIIGDNDTEKNEDYGALILRNFSSTYPLQYVSAKIADEEDTPFPSLKKDLPTFLSNNPTYDFRTVSVIDLPNYDFSGIEDQDAFMHEVATMQRLMHLSTDYNVINAFASNGIVSAVHLIRLARPDFISDYTEVIGSVGTAQGVYMAARATVHTSMLMAFTMAKFNMLQFNSLQSQFPPEETSLLAPSPTVASLASPTTPMAMSFASFTVDVYADWRNLFGALDNCECAQCQSVYSPSAYLVDTLKFLSDSNTAMRDELLIHRRPDIKNIYLSCKNTNTPLPYIDIVNELLEDMVSTTLSSTTYTTYARQTVADADMQRAAPEYVNTSGETIIIPGSTTPITIVSPYPTLKTASYPWSLPFNYYKREIDTSLEIVDVAPHDLFQKFSGYSELTAWQQNTYCMHYVGLTSEEWGIIVTATPTMGDLYTAYGFRLGTVDIPDPATRGNFISVTPANWSDVLMGRVDVFLQQTGLQYIELLQLLECYALNPHTTAAPYRQLYIKKNDPSYADDTCELDQLEIASLSITAADNFRKLLYRFVRMARALGWSYYELDKAMTCLSVSDINAVIFNQLAQIKYLSNTLNLSIEDTCVFWHDINIDVYRNYESSDLSSLPTQYQAIFRNKLLTDIDVATYPFRELPITTSFPQNDIQTYFAGILNISGNDLSDLLANIYAEAPIIPPGPPILPSIHFLTRVYREAVLLKALRLTVSEWIFFKLWIANAQYFGTTTSIPYDSYVIPFLSPIETIRFVNFVRQVKNSGASTTQFDFILRDKPLDSITDTAANTDMANVLTTLRSDLYNTWDPSYDGTTDTDSSELHTRLLTIIDSDQAERLISIVERTSSSTPSYDSSDHDLILLDIPFLFSPFPGTAVDANASLTVIGSILPPYISITSDRRNYVFRALNAYIQQHILKPLIINDIADKYGIADDIAYLLLDEVIKINVTIGSVTTLMTGFQILMLSQYILSINSPTPDIDRWTTTDYQYQFHTLLLFQKAGMLINNYGLGLSDVDYIWRQVVIPDMPLIAQLPIRQTVSVLPAPMGAGTMPVVFRQMENMLRWMNVRAVLGPNMSVLYNRLATISTTVKGTTVNDIAAAFSMSPADTIQLLGTTGTGRLNATYYTDYVSPILYLRIIDCLEIQHALPSTMSNLSDAADAVETPASQSQANIVIQLVRAQYNSTTWLSVVRPISDKTRVERRDALLTYLLANPPAPYHYQWYTSNDIFNTLMIDIQMMSCMTSSRIALAINTIQLWVDRILLGLEQYYTGSTPPYSLLKLSDEEAREWAAWRKLYRVWEANRKVFIYPENYILPELRDNKSPFFKEVEDFLNQNDLNDSNIEDAYTAYLEKLEEVSHLQIVAMYRKTRESFYNPDVDIDDIVHVIGRTKSSPHIYYYRKRVDKIWTAWEKMNIQPESDHFVAVMWRGRLRLYWLMFTQQLVENRRPGAETYDHFIPPAATQWKIDIQWSELKNGNWTPPQVGRESLYSFPITEESPYSLEQINYFSYPHNGVQRIWFLNGALNRQKKNIMFFSQLTGNGDLTFVVQEKVVCNSGPGLNGMFMDTVNYPFNAMYYAHHMEEALEMILENESYQDAFPNQPGVFYHKYNGIYALPIDQFNYTMFLRLHWWHQYKLPATPFHYVGSTYSGYSHYPDDIEQQLLKRAPDVDELPSGKYIMIPMNADGNSTGDWEGAPKIMTPYFFYKDYMNNFFVEKLVTYVTIPIHVGATYVFVAGWGTVSLSSGTVVPSPSGAAAGYSSVPGVYYMRFPVGRYKFHNFYHNKVNDFREKLYKEGLDGLINGYFLSSLPDTIQFNSNYWPTTYTDTNYPTDKVTYNYDDPNSIYNWELFFHIPLLIANKLSQNQQFAEARRWYHYIFNPTSGNNSSVAQFWNFSKFYDESAYIPSPMDIMTDPDLSIAVHTWAMNPFNPHLIARTRISAYMKNTVMKYLDNLIAWGDNLFGQNTAETINEATLLYVMAAQLLGPEPPSIPARAVPEMQTFATLSTAGLSAFGNALVHIETLLLPSGMTTAGTSATPLTNMYYFCLIPNDKLLAYWDILADRLFKIRNCMTLDGVVQDLPLFAPPIDPAILVSAAASGMSVAAAVAGLNAPLPFYRFNVLSQKATEIIQEVKSLGGQLLAALEKKDAEYLSVLRSTQEIRLLNAITQLKELAIQEATEQIDILQTQLKSVQQRIDFYKGLLDGSLNASEKLQMGMYTANMVLHTLETGYHALGAVYFGVPTILTGTLFGLMYGGRDLGNVVDEIGESISALSSLFSDIGSKAGLRGGYDRRDQEWSQQLAQSQWEHTQVQQQIIAAQIRQTMSKTELSNHKLQIQNAQDMDTALRTKFTNEDLYNWMISQISGSYFLAYRMASEIAHKAERAYRNELNLDTSNFIQYGYWDSLHKGLLAGDQLHYDLKRMELSYLDLNQRRFEMTKNVSLAALNPDALMVLKANKACTISLPEWLYDLDYPGQYMRRIKSVSISIPCVAGPYTTISCKLTLQSSKYRKNTSLVSGYPEDPSGDGRFNYIFGNVQAITTSSAQNDSGMFEMNFRDERYLPFEGAGAISTWLIELPPAYAQFDYNSISDIILHVKYTAMDNGMLEAAAGAYLGTILDGSAGSGGSNLFRLFNLRSEFATQWHQMMYGTSHVLLLENLQSRMPYLAQAAGLTVTNIEIYCVPDLTMELKIGSMTYPLTETPVSAVASKYVASTVSFDLTHQWEITMDTDSGPVTPADVKDAWMVLYYAI